MRKILFSFISVLLLASCAPKVPPTDINIPTSSPAQGMDITISPSFNSPSTSPSSTVLPSEIPSSQVLYKSCKKGDSISKTLTTGDIKFFLTTPPEELFDILGNRSEIMGYVEDYDVYVAPCDYLGISLQYTCDVDWDKEPIVEIPRLPIKNILIFDFEFYGLNKESTFKEVKNLLGKTKVLVGYAEDWEYYYLQYKIDGMLFKFSGSDSEASDGVGLSIMPDKN